MVIRIATKIAVVTVSCRVGHTTLRISACTWRMNSRGVALAIVCPACCVRLNLASAMGSAPPRSTLTGRGVETPMSEAAAQIATGARQGKGGRVGGGPSLAARHLHRLSLEEAMAGKGTMPRPRLAHLRL